MAIQVSRWLAMTTSRAALFESIRELWNIAAALKDQPGFREIASDTATRSSELWTRALGYRPPKRGGEQPLGKAQELLAQQRTLTRDFAAKEWWGMYDLAATLEARYAEIVQAMEELQARCGETRRIMAKAPSAADGPVSATGTDGV